MKYRFLKPIAELDTWEKLFEAKVDTTLVPRLVTLIKSIDDDEAFRVFGLHIFTGYPEPYKFTPSRYEQNKDFFDDYMKEYGIKIGRWNIFERSISHNLLFFLKPLGTDVYDFTFEEFKKRGNYRRAVSCRKQADAKNSMM